MLSDNFVLKNYSVKEKGTETKKSGVNLFHTQSSWRHCMGAAICYKNIQTAQIIRAPEPKALAKFIPSWKFRERIGAVFDTDQPCKPQTLES